VFIYLVSEAGVDAFRRFLQRYGELFAALPAWTLRIVLPRHLDSLAGPCQDLVRQELASPLRDDVLSELKRYFKQRQASAIERSAIQDDESYHEARFAFGAPRFEVLYRRWLSEGDVALEIVSSQAIAHAIERGTGRVECHVLPFSYRHLSPLVASSRRALQGAEEGDDAPSQPRPLSCRQPRRSIRASKASANALRHHAKRLHGEDLPLACHTDGRLNGRRFCRPTIAAQVQQRRS
jgi:hypothetical protein